MGQIIQMRAVVLLTWMFTMSFAKRDFNVTWYDGRTENFRFPYTTSSECIFSQQKDVLTCMRNSDFGTIVSTWHDHPGDIKYLSVSCRKQAYYAYNKNVCLCKKGSMRSDPSLQLQNDRFYYCQLNRIYQNTFSSLSGLQILDLSHNNISQIHSESFRPLISIKLLNLGNNPIRDLPEGLICGPYALSILMASHTNLSIFPSHIFHCSRTSNNITYVDLSNGKIDNMPQGSLLYLTELISLNLSKNYISDITTDSVKGGSAIRMLDLSYNSIKEVKVNLCSELKSLEHLLLKDNGLIRLNFSLFAACNSLKHLDLSCNFINDITGHIRDIPALRSLRLYDNPLGRIHFTDVFVNATNVEELDLSLGDIHRLDDDVFRGMRGLTVLNISLNSIGLNHTNFPRVFRDLAKLVRLDLHSNDITYLPKNSFFNLSRLEFLDLSYNKLEILEKGCLTGLSSIRHLHLNNNNLVDITYDLIMALSNLHSLDLAGNKIRHLDNLAIPSKLFSLDLGYNQLSSIPNCLKNSAINALSMTGNKVNALRSSVFEGMSQLRKLELKSCELESLEPNAFSGLSGLEKLILDNNRISLDSPADVFEGATNIKEVQLSRNLIRSVAGILSSRSLSKVEIFNVSYNPINTIGRLLHKNMSSHGYIQYIIARNGNISQLSQDTFDGLEKLRNVDMEGNKIETFKPFLANVGIEYRLFGNPLICSCDMSWLTKSFVSVGSRRFSTYFYHVGECSLYPYSLIRPPRNVPESQYLCPVKEDCDESCFCYTREKGTSLDIVICQRQMTLPDHLSPNARTIFLDGHDFWELGGSLSFAHYGNMSTRELYLNHSRITDLDPEALTHLPLLRKLDLGANVIKTLKAGVFQNQRVLEELYVNDNVISTLELGVFDGLEKLKILDLRGNHFQYLSPELLSEISALTSLTWISLGRNPWECDCRGAHLRDWINSNYNRVMDRHTVMCGDKLLAAVEPAEFTCTYKYHLVNTKGAITAIVISVMLVMCLLAATVYYRRDVMACAYAKCGLTCLRPATALSDQPYDIFLVHDSCDGDCSQWVNHVFLPRIQKGPKGHQVFLADRLQTSILDTTTQCIMESRCALFVISKRFMMRSWCVKCFQRAWDYAQENKKFRIIIIIHDDVEIQTLEPGMKVILGRGSYLTSGSLFFWSRLWFELPDAQIRDDISDADDVSESDVILHSSFAMDAASDESEV